MASPVSRGLGTAAALAAGAALGVLAERLVARRWLAESPTPTLPVVAHRHEVVLADMDDEAVLHVEVDTPDGWVVGDPTVILVHGFGLSLDTWSHQRRELLTVARVVTYDHRGHGRSAAAQDATHDRLTIDRLGVDLTRVIEQVAPESPLVLVGHSMGGMTVMSLAEQQPEWFGERIVGVALLATSAGMIDSVDLGLPAPLARLAHRLTPAVSSVVDRGDWITRLVTAIRDSSSDVARVLTRTYAFGDSVPAQATELVAHLLGTTRLDVVGDLLLDINRHDRFDALSVIGRVRVVVIVGDADLLTPVGHSRRMHERMTSSELVVLPGVGHMLMMEKPHEVDACLEDFVRAVTATTTARESGR